MGAPQRPTSANTIRHTHKVITTALYDAVERDLIIKNPAKRVSKNLVKGKESQVHSLTNGQLERLFEEERESQYHALWVFYVLTGCRRGEAAAIRWSSIDWKNRTVTVTHTAKFQRKNERLGLAAGIEIGPLKTRGSRRVIPINDDLVAVLEAHRTRQRFLASSPKWQDNDLVFCDPTGKCLNPDTVTLAFKRALRRAGIPNASLHSLRHTFATLLFRDNVHLKSVSSMLGHSSTSITADTYTDSINEVNVEAVKGLNGIVRPQSA